MSKGILGGLFSLFVLLALDISSIIEGLGVLAVIITGPALFALYMVNVSNSNKTDFNALSVDNRLKFVGVLFGMVLSTTGLFMYLLNNPTLLWS